MSLQTCKQSTITNETIFIILSQGYFYEIYLVITRCMWDREIIGTKHLESLDPEKNKKPKKKQNKN